MVQRMGQSLNVAGVSQFVRSAWSEPSSTLPHMDVASLSTVDWAELWSKGFRACVFDKDNTLTLPYSLEIHPDVADSLAQCLKIFQNRVVLFSNSAGLAQFDPDGASATIA